MSWIDVKLGLRILHKQPVVTVVAVLTLALGIPVGMFPTHLAHAFEAPLPVDEGERIRALRYPRSGASPTGLADLVYWRERLTTFEALAATTMLRTFNVVYDDGSIAPIDGAWVTASTFDVLRVPPLLGRTLVAADERTGAPEVVVIGQEVWQSRLAGDPDVIGRVLRVGGLDRTVVGVMPESFRFPMRDLLWLPLRAPEGADAEDAGPPLVVFGRLADGVSEAEALAELAVVGGAPTPARDEARSRWSVDAVPFFTVLGDVRNSEFVVVQLLALLVLAVACANVAMLIFARTVRRASELAVRTALGASRARVVSQLFIEALLLAVLAAGTGLFIGDQVVLRLFAGPFVDQQFPVWLDLGVRSGTVVQALVLAAVSAGLAGVLPALRVTGKAVQPSLQRTATARSGLRFGGVSSALIVTDVALAVAASCFAIYFAPHGSNVDDGTEGWSSQFLAARLSMSAGTGRETSDSAGVLRATQQELLRRLRVEPGVRGVTFASHVPGMDHATRRFEVEEPGTGGPTSTVTSVSVEPGFFETLGQPILRGRGLVQSDVEEGSAVIVNTDFVDRILAGRNPLGRRIRYAARGDEPPGPWLHVVGVVGRLGTHNPNSDEPRYEAVYHPLRAGEVDPVGIVVGLAEDPASFTARLRQVAMQVDPALIIDDSVPLDEVRSFIEFARRMIVLGGLVLAGILVGLAASGAYALMSFTVTQRTREIGIRTALGSGRSRIVLGIGRRALAQLGLGALVGMGLGGWMLAAEQGASSFPLFTPLILGAALLVLIGLLACTGPTLRALRITPTEALKAEG